MTKQGMGMMDDMSGIGAGLKKPAEKLPEQKQEPKMMSMTTAPDGTITLKPIANVPEEAGEYNESAAPEDLLDRKLSQRMG